MAVNGPKALEHLTAYEIVICELVSIGFTNGEISARLDMKEDTLKSKIRVIFRKLGAVNRHHLVRRLYEMGFFYVSKEDISKSVLSRAAAKSYAIDHKCDMSMTCICRQGPVTNYSTKIKRG